MSALTHFEQAFFDEDFIPEWEMTNFERLVFVALVERIRPNLALEIGSRNGGSLQILQRYCRHVISLDVDKSVEGRLKARFPEVEFRVGDSRKELPKLLHDLQAQNHLPDFIFIDGDHTSEGAASDVHHALNVMPATRNWVLVHDTFNPTVRAGVTSCRFNDYPHLHFADIDFAPGIQLDSGPLKGEIWGGFSLFILEPSVRKEEIVPLHAWQNLWELISAHDIGLQ